MKRIIFYQLKFMTAFINIKYFILTFFLIASASLCRAGEDLDALYDPWTGKRIYYFTNDKEMEGKEGDIYDELDTDFPVFKKMINKMAEAKINLSIRNIMLSQIKTDDFRKKLITDAVEKLNTRLKPEKPKNKLTNRLKLENPKNKKGVKTYKRTDLTPELTDVSFVFLSFSNHIVTFKVNFTYDIKQGRSVVEEDLIYAEVYYFNMQSGKEYTPDDVFMPEARERVNNIILEKLKATLKDLKKNYPDKDSLLRKVNDIIIYTPGYAYLQLFSLSYYMPYCSISANAENQGVEIRFTVEELTGLINPQGPYAFLLQKKYKKMTSQDELYSNPEQKKYKIRGLNDVLDGAYNSRETELDSIVIHNKDLKTATLYTQQDGGSRYKKLSVQFNSHQKLTEIYYYDQNDAVTASKKIDYDSSGRITSCHNFNNNRPNFISYFTYDSQNRISSYEIYDYNDEVACVSYYRYRDTLVFEETFYTYGQVEDFEPEWRVYNYDRKGHFLYTDELSTYKTTEWLIKYDQAGREIGISPINNMSYTYNEKGNLISFERDNNDMETYDYNAKNQLISVYRNSPYVKTISYNAKGLPEKVNIYRYSPEGTQSYMAYTYEYGY
jgi:hypothetical protein